jgi:uncharacterized membrane protein YhaH (DUF805 family)
MKWYLKVLRQYADFSGRAGRKEYWMFVLVNSIFSIVPSTLDWIFGTVGQNGIMGVIYFLYMAGVLVPTLAVIVRRLHDTGRSGLMLLIALVPVSGWFILLLMLLAKSSDSKTKSSDTAEDFLRQYADFSGRAGREEYWMFVLYNSLVLLFLYIVVADTMSYYEEIPLIMYSVFIVYSLLILIPSLVITVRRLHDIGKSGWMILINLIPVAGTIYCLVLLCLDSNSGENCYGHKFVPQDL